MQTVQSTNSASATGQGTTLRLAKHLEMPFAEKAAWLKGHYRAGSKVQRLHKASKSLVMDCYWGRTNGARKESKAHRIHKTWDRLIFGSNGSDSQRTS